jgi:DNA-binding NarL/FixJ family response regulator
MAEILMSVLVVDDDYYAREAQRALVSKDHRTRVWDTVEGVTEALTALRQTGRPLPDVVLLDVNLGGDERGGVEAIGHIAELAPSAKILMTSAYRNEEIILAAIHEGAHGFVWKNESTDGIVDALVRVVEGRFVVTRSIAERLLGKAVELGSYVTEILPEKPEYRELTESVRKTVYLYCFCGMSAKEIAEELQISVNTVNSRLKVAYQAMEAGSRQEAFQRLVERPRE